jgi:hypothetical protein
MLVDVFSCYHYLCGFKDIKNNKQHCCCFSNVLYCCFCWISSWSVGALFLLFILSCSFHNRCQVVALQNTLNSFFLIFGASEL